jgi:hypothetical protein
MTERSGPHDLEILAIWAGEKESTPRYIAYADLMSHPAVFEAPEKLEFSEHAYVVSALYLKDLLAGLPLAQSCEMVLAECTDLYQSNFDLEFIEDRGAYLSLALDGHPVYEWAAEQERSDWGPYLAGLVDYENLLNPGNKKPWGIVSLELLPSAVMPWNDKVVAAGELAQEGAVIYRNSCLNCHAYDDTFGGDLSNRTLPILAVHARFNRPHLEAMLRDPVGTLPTAARMPVMDYYTDYEVDRLVAFLDAAAP